MNISKEKKKELVMDYKLRPTSGGVYRIVNLESGRYLLGTNFDLPSFQNRFQFSRKTGSCMHVKLQRDWSLLGPEQFQLEILEEIQQQPEETRDHFKGRLKEIEQAWSLKFDQALRY